ncbi:MAG: DPP IV N-terminal domain-containing protein, partial [Mucilaginibacter sp.]
MKKILIILLLSGCSGAFAQSLAPLSIEKIMRDPRWIGVAPSNIRWSDDSKKIYFNWNPENTDRDQLFAITPTDIKPAKVSPDERKAMIPEYGDWNKKHTLKVFEKNGDVFLSDLATGKITQLTNTAEREGSPSFSGDETKVIFTRGENLYSFKIAGGELVQLTNFTHSATATPAPAAGGRRGGGRRNATDVVAGNDQERWLKAQQLEV